VFVLNASGRDVYGPVLEPAKAEVAIGSLNRYVSNKGGLKALANAHRHMHDFVAVSLRLANAYGSIYRNRLVIPIFVILGNGGEPLTVYGESKLLNFVRISDVCDAILGPTTLVDGEAIKL
jgi:nucleoside-diphosphate-sugar epimerase